MNATPPPGGSLADTVHWPWPSRSPAIDGCHRLYKAARLGREHLPSLVLTAEETLAIRHDAILGPPHTPAR